MIDYGYAAVGAETGFQWGDLWNQLFPCPVAEFNYREPPSSPQSANSYPNDIAKTYNLDASVESENGH